MASLVPLDNHLAGLLKLVPPFWGLPRAGAWLVSYLREIQFFSDACWAVMNSWSTAVPTGATLDKLGRLVGEMRSGLDDVDYWTLIKGRIFVNRSTGALPDLLTLWTFITGAAYRYLESYPLTFEITQLAPGANAYGTMQLIELLSAIRAAGYRGYAHLLPAGQTRNAQLIGALTDADGIATGPALLSTQRWPSIAYNGTVDSNAAASGCDTRAL